LWKGRGRSLDLRKISGRAEQIFIPEGPVERAELHHELGLEIAAQQRSAPEKDAIARTLAGEVGVDYDSILARRILHLMTPAEVAALDPAVVDVQMHTH